MWFEMVKPLCKNLNTFVATVYNLGWGVRGTVLQNINADTKRLVTVDFAL